MSKLHYQHHYHIYSLLDRHLDRHLDRQLKTFDIGRIDFYHEPFAGLKIHKIEAWRLDMKIILLKKEDQDYLW